MDSNPQVQGDQYAALRAGLTRWAMIRVVMPACWMLVLFANIKVAIVVWFGVTAAYLGLLFTLSLTTMFAEDKYGDRLKLWRRVLAIGGRIALTGIIGFLYFSLFVGTRYGPDSAQ